MSSDREAVNQFRKANPKTPAPRSNSTSIDHRVSLHNRVPFININNSQKSQYSDSNKENVWSTVNKENEQHFQYVEEEDGYGSLSNAKTTRFQNPLSQEYETKEHLGPFLSSAKTVSSSRLKESLQMVHNSSFLGQDDLIEDYEDQARDHADNMIITQLQEQKKKIEEDLKDAKQLVLKTRKENNQNLKRVQADNEKEKDEIHLHYTKIIKELEAKHEQELKDKDEEIDALNSVISSNDESEKGKEDKNINTIIEQYEEMIRSIKSEFQEELEKMSNYYKKKAQQHEEEKERLNEEIKELKNQLSQQQLPITARYEPGNESSRLELETTNRINPIENIQVKTKAKQEPNISKLLNKINQYLDENTIENEVSITNRRNLYKEICHTQNAKSKSIDIKPLNLAALQLPKDIKQKNMPVVGKQKGSLEEEEESEYFKNIMEECKRNRDATDVCSEEEEDDDRPMMNYTIKNLNNQLKFKPKYEDEK